MRIGHWFGLGAVVALLMTAGAQGAIVFDDFNVNEGHFNQVPTYSSTSTVLTTSTADRTTAAGEVFAGAGSQKLVLNMGTNTTRRARHLSGLGTPANNTSFSVSSASTDGYIGFVYKVVGAGNGVQFGMNLDGPANSGATMVGGVLKSAVADGAWHLVEWNLDLLADWGAVAGIGGVQANLNDGTMQPKTIDSIYFYNMAVSTTTTVLIDQVTKSDSGSIAALLAAGKAINAAPPNGDNTVDPSLSVLGWAAGSEFAKSFNVYFGTDSLTLQSSNQAGTSWALPTLLPNTTYQWRIDSKNNLGSVTTGDVWTFTTTPEPTTMLVLGLGSLVALRRRWA